MRHHIALSVVLAAGICSGLPASLPAEQAAKTHTILIKGFQFVPDRLEVATGDTVVWRNEDIVPHTATAKKEFDSKGIEKGQSWKHVAKQKGSYPYICTYHPTMRGELIVK